MSKKPITFHSAAIAGHKSPRATMSAINVTSHHIVAVVGM